MPKRPVTSKRPVPSVTSVTTCISIAGDNIGRAVAAAEEPTPDGAREIFPRINPKNVMNMDEAGHQKLLVDVDAAYAKLKAMVSPAPSER